MSRDKPVSDKRTEAERLHRAQNYSRAHKLASMCEVDLVCAISAFAAEEVARAVAEEREVCAKAMCEYCRDEDIPELRAHPGHPTIKSYYHGPTAHEDQGGWYCGANSIHERTREGE